MRQFHWNKIKKEILRIIAEYFHRQVKNEQLTIKDSWEICWFKQRQMSGILHPRRIWLLTQSIQHQTMDFQIQKYLNGLGIGAEGYSCDTEWEQNQVPYSYPYLSHYYLVHTWFFLDVYISNSQAAKLKILLSLRSFFFSINLFPRS